MCVFVCVHVSGYRNWDSMDFNEVKKNKKSKKKEKKNIFLILIKNIDICERPKQTNRENGRKGKLRSKGQTWGLKKQKGL